MAGGGGADAGYYHHYGCYQIGITHGSEAKDRVHGSLSFYQAHLKKVCGLDWEQVREEAARYVEPLERTCPRYVDEMRGVAEGSGLELLDIVAINVRTEIMFGLWTDDDDDDDDGPETTTRRTTSAAPEIDGCTAMSWKVDGARPDGGGGTGGGSTSFLSQNWDWSAAQEPNLIVCHISQPGGAVAGEEEEGARASIIPDLSMVTEAGIIGKIGLNARGVGCCLNAIRARGVDPSRLPVHLALRAVLESGSMAEAVSRVRASGTASSAHILVADATGSVGLECTSGAVREVEADDRGRVLHANHLVLEHPEAEEPPWLDDSARRVDRLRELADGIVAGTGSGAAGVTAEALAALYRDEEGYPASICRHQVGGSTFQTLFNIVMDLTGATATVLFGRPTSPHDRVTLRF